MINIKLLKDGLKELSSKDIQLELWVNGNEDNLSSFVEAKSYVFDDSGLSRAIDNGYLSENFSKDLNLKIMELSKQIDKMPEDLEPIEIVEHEDMELVCNVSLELLLIINSKF